MELAELTVRGFTEEIASASPAPGGGSAAALAGAVGAALTAMVSGLTLGRKKYEAVQELALRAQAQADVLRKRLLAAMEQDTQAFLPSQRGLRDAQADARGKAGAQQRHRTGPQGLHAAAACRDAAVRGGAGTAGKASGKDERDGGQRFWCRLPQPSCGTAGRMAERVHQHRLSVRRCVCRRCACSGAETPRCWSSSCRALLRGNVGCMQ